MDKIIKISIIKVSQEMWNYTSYAFTKIQNSYNHQTISSSGALLKLASSDIGITYAAWNVSTIMRMLTEC